MRHVEVKVVLMELNLLAVVVELRHALSADHKESVIVQTKFSITTNSSLSPIRSVSTPFLGIRSFISILFVFYFLGAKFGNYIQISLS